MKISPFSLYIPFWSTPSTSSPEKQIQVQRILKAISCYIQWQMQPYFQVDSNEVYLPQLLNAEEKPQHVVLAESRTSNF